jgi:hypothetical protein
MCVISKKFHVSRRLPQTRDRSPGNDVFSERRIFSYPVHFVAHFHGDR